MDFIPNVGLIVILAPMLAAALIYSAPDEYLFHELLSKRVSESKGNMEEFMFLTMFTFHIFKAPSWKLLSKSFRVPETRTTVLESGDLDSRIWKLRGAFWFVVSVPLSAIIVASVFQWNQGIIMLLVAIVIVVSSMVVYPSVKSYEETVSIFENLIEFYLFDRALSIVRRWEASVKPREDSPKYSIDHLAETIYRGIRAAKIQDTKEIEEILKPSYHFSGKGDPVRRETRVEIEESTPRGLQPRVGDSVQFHSLIHEESEWLRELIRRESWAAFRLRFLDLKEQIRGRGHLSLQDIDKFLIVEWTEALRLDAETHSFTQLRALCHKLQEIGLIPDKKLDQVENLLKYDESHMTNHSWAFQYWYDLIEENLNLALDLFHSVYQSIRGTRTEAEWSSDYYTDRYEEMKEGRIIHFGKSAVSLEDSKPMKYHDEF